MKKPLLFAALFGVAATQSVNAQVNVDDVWYITSKETETGNVYKFDVEFPANKDLTDKQSLYLELSKYSDFTFIEKVYEFNKSNPSLKYYSCELNPSELTEGEYYYRAAVYNAASKWCDFKVYNSPPAKHNQNAPGLTKIIGTKVSENQGYSIMTDTNAYDDIPISDDTKLSIESVWLRSGLNGQPLMPTTPPGLNPLNRSELIGTLENYANPPFDSFSHGAIVSDGTIYIGVGSSCSFNPAVTGPYANLIENPNPDRLMLYRYDLATGDFISTVRIKDKNGKEISQTECRMMPWLRVDDAGTPYFLCPPLHVSYNKPQYATPAYTLDLSKISTTEATSGIATLIADSIHHREDIQLAEKETDYMFGTISGDIKNKPYRVWGMKYDRSVNSKSSSLWQTNIKTWDVTSKFSRVSLNTYAIDANPFTSNEKIFTSYTPKIYPIDNTHVYTHAAPALVVGKTDFAEYDNYEPAFYELDEKGMTATLKNKLSDAITSDMDIAPATDTKRMSGFPIIQIGDITVAAYGHLSENNNATAVQLIQIKDPTLGFEPGNIVPLWDLFKETGLSTSLFQALDMTFIPAEQQRETTQADDSNLLGHLLVYASGAGMGLYRINSLENEPVNSIDRTLDDNSIEIKGTSLIINKAVTSIDILDMQGRIVRHYDNPACGTYPLPSLAKGVYIMRTPTTATKFTL